MKRQKGLGRAKKPVLCPPVFFITNKSDSNLEGATFNCKYAVMDLLDLHNIKHGFTYLSSGIFRTLCSVIALIFLINFLQSLDSIGSKPTIVTVSAGSDLSMYLTKELAYLCGKVTSGNTTKPNS
ncbi:MAG TPA: hypothetical protein VI298_05440 [Geobacteraceae bacterium]